MKLLLALPMIALTTLVLSSCGSSGNANSNEQANNNQVSSQGDLPTQADAKGWTKVTDGAWQMVETNENGVFISQYTDGSSKAGLQWMLDEHMKQIQAAKAAYPELDFAKILKENPLENNLKGQINNFSNLRAQATADCTVNGTAAPSGSNYIVAYALAGCRDGSGSDARTGVEYNGSRILGNKTPWSSSAGYIGSQSQATGYSGTSAPNSTRDCARALSTSGSIFKPGPSLTKLWGKAYSDAYSCPTF